MVCECGGVTYVGERGWCVCVWRGDVRRRERVVCVCGGVMYIGEGGIGGERVEV